MVGDGEVQPEQADNGADEAFGLPEREAEDGSQDPCRQDRQGRVVGLPALGCPWLGLSRLDGFIGEPDRQAPTLAQAGIILAPVCCLVLMLGNVVTAVLIQPEGHAGHPGTGEGSFCYSGPTSGAISWIRATTPSGAVALRLGRLHKPMRVYFDPLSLRQHSAASGARWPMSVTTVSRRPRHRPH